MKKLDAVQKLESALRNSQIKFVREFQFLKGYRNFRFDFLITEIEGIDLLEKGIKIAVEFEGGVFTKGGHTRGLKYTLDCEKYNLAILNGYQVLRYTTKYLDKRNGEYIIAEEVKGIFRQIKQNYKTILYSNYFGKTRYLLEEA